jgi:hypothetical protein
MQLAGHLPLPASPTLVYSHSVSLALDSAWSACHGLVDEGLPDQKSNFSTLKMLCFLRWNFGASSLTLKTVTPDVLNLSVEANIS